MKLDEIKEQIFEDEKRLLFKSLEERYARATAFWLQKRGNVTTQKISTALHLNNDTLTRKIRDQIVALTGVQIPDNTPQVTIYKTSEEIDKEFPRTTMATERSHTLEIFYYLANPQIYQRHEESIYRGTDF